MQRLRRSFLHALLGLLAAGACSEHTARNATAVGDVLASVPLVSLEDGVPAAADMLRGPLVVNFWASWCAPCRSEMPALERLSHRLAAHGVAVIGITLDDDLNLAREFVRSSGLSLPTYTPSGANRLGEALGIKTLPHTIVLRADGTLAAALPGARDWDAGALCLHLPPLCS